VARSPANWPAGIYGLDVVARHIEDQANNTTRFLVMSRDADPSRRADQMITTFIFRVRNIPAALYKAWAASPPTGSNMTKLERLHGRRLVHRHRILRDIEGHPEDPPVKRALEELGYFTTQLQILGVYPPTASATRAEPRPPCQRGHDLPFAKYSHRSPPWPIYGHRSNKMMPPPSL